MVAGPGRSIYVQFLAVDYGLHDLLDNQKSRIPRYTTAICNLYISFIFTLSRSVSFSVAHLMIIPPYYPMQ